MPEPLETPVLLTPRLRLRRPEERDAPDIYAALSDAEAMTYLNRSVATRPEEGLEMVRFAHQMERDGVMLRWAVALRETDAYAGSCMLFSFDRRDQRAEIGFALARAYWGQGYMTEAARAVIAHAWDALGLHRLEAEVHPDNAAALALLARLGFEQEGRRRERWCIDGVFNDTIVLGLVR